MLYIYLIARIATHNETEFELHKTKTEFELHQTKRNLSYTKRNGIWDTPHGTEFELHQTKLILSNT